ncbi:hypothetical protein D3P08_00440 [Paenibacillus nanensis]|uniref:Uncharacterized protein n=1 Tax=Paenibacillus nanensis TaxID=393251 RepID=A0A3A1VKE0_9BACL|nr:hypothetical protein [Paenibacillus nanensis]RIX60096.1 hypothetical protein D3P08_00440 [Paenibacillus nanensis]
MNAVRLYDTPEQFAEMMVNQLRSSMGALVKQTEGEALLLKVSLDAGKPEEELTISLHDTYRSYMASGDLNAAVDYLNQIVKTSSYMQRYQEEMCKLDASYLFPAVRDERYVTEAGRDMEFLSDPFLPGLRIIYLEIKGGVTKIVNKSMLERNPRLSEEKMRRLAYRNLRAAGWQKPRISLTSPFCKSCTIEIYSEPPHPIDYQFSMPEWRSLYLPDNYVIAYTNRQYMMLLRSYEPMDSEAQVKRLVQKSKFSEIVKRSFHVMPNPVSVNMYWVHKGKTVQL